MCGYRHRNNQRFLVLDSKISEARPSGREAAYRAMQTPMKGGVHFVETPARDALEILSEALGLDLIIQWHYLGTVDGLNPDAPINLRLKRAVSLEAIIPRALSQMGEANSATWSLDNAVFSGSNGGSILGDIFDWPVESDENQTSENRKSSEKERVRLIYVYDLIDPYQWELSGGTAGRITHRPGALIVSTPSRLPPPSDRWVLIRPKFGPELSGCKKTGHQTAFMRQVPTKSWFFCLRGTTISSILTVASPI